MPDRVAIVDSLALLSAVTKTDFRPLLISHPPRLCLGSYPKKMDLHPNFRRSHAASVARFSWICRFYGNFGAQNRVE
jgi:hypothetical protein